MSINFGKVEKYFDKKGFGFVTRKINSKGKPAIFFHIKTIEQSDPDLALKLKNNEIENLFFWYDSEKTNKGKQVRCVIQPTEIDISKHPELLKKIKNKWLDLYYPDVPSWFREAISQISSGCLVIDLDKERNSLLEQRKKEQLEREQKRKEEKEKYLRIQEEERIKRNAEIERLNQQYELEENEFKALVEEMRQFNFTKSAQVSDYIVRHNLGLKYQNILGILEMTKDGNTWNFRGGFPPKIYAKLCAELELGNEGTNARAGNFTSFKDEIELSVDDI